MYVTDAVLSGHGAEAQDPSRVSTDTHGFDAAGRAWTTQHSSSMCFGTGSQGLDTAGKGWAGWFAPQTSASGMSRSGSKNDLAAASASEPSADLSQAEQQSLVVVVKHHLEGQRVFRQATALVRRVRAKCGLSGASTGITLLSPYFD